MKSVRNVRTQPNYKTSRLVNLLDGAIVVLYSADAWNSAHWMGWDGHAIET